jgi:hypothetical protein
MTIKGDITRGEKIEEKKQHTKNFLVYFVRR